MIALCWNCRGLGTPRSVGALRELVQRWDPMVVFLTETKKKNAGMTKVRMKIGFENGFYVKKEGKGGGLAILWRREVNLEIKSYSIHQIDAMIIEEGAGFQWRLTGLYGHPETLRQNDSWNFLDALNRQFKLPWLCFGDFNAILSLKEKLGGVPRSQNQMESFRGVVNRCGFKDMDYCKADFTWCNQQEGVDRVYLRLDHAFATLDWLEHFCNLIVHHLVNATSDHCPLPLTEASSLRRSKERRFHFKALWTTKADCKEVIEEVWNSGSNLGTSSGFAARLKQCSSALSSWSMGVYGNIPKEIEEKKKYLHKLTMQDKEGQNGAEINSLKKEINELLDGEEVWWQ